MSSDSDAATRGTLLVLAAAAGFGLNPLFARMIYAAGATPELAVFYRFGVPVVLSLFLLGPIRRHPREAIVAIALGAFFALSILGYYRAFAVLPVAVVVLIFFTFPLFTVVLERLLFGIRPGWPQVAGAGLVLGAVAIIVNPQGIPADAWGVVPFAFVSAIGYAMVILVFGHVLGETALSVRIGALYIGSAAVAFAMVPLAGVSFMAPEGAGGAIGMIGLITVAGVLRALPSSVRQSCSAPDRTGPLPEPARSGTLRGHEPLETRHGADHAGAGDSGHCDRPVAQPA